MAPAGDAPDRQTVALVPVTAVDRAALAGAGVVASVGEVRAIAPHVAAIVVRPRDRTAQPRRIRHHVERLAAVVPCRAETRTTARRAALSYRERHRPHRRKGVLRDVCDLDSVVRPADNADRHRRKHRVGLSDQQPNAVRLARPRSKVRIRKV